MRALTPEGVAPTDESGPRHTRRARYRGPFEVLRMGGCGAGGSNVAPICVGGGSGDGIKPAFSRSNYGPNGDGGTPLASRHCPNRLGFRDTWTTGQRASGRPAGSSSVRRPGGAKELLLSRRAPALRDLRELLRRRARYRICLQAGADCRDRVRRRPNGDADERIAGADREQEVRHCRRAGRGLSGSGAASRRSRGRSRSRSPPGHSATRRRSPRSGRARSGRTRAARRRGSPRARR